MATPALPSDDLIPSLLAASDVLGTGWYAAAAARVQPGATVVVVGDGAVGLMGVLAAKQMEAGRIIAMSRHKTRQDLALEFGATDIVSERGDAGVAEVKRLTKGVGAESVLECVGMKESMFQGPQLRPARRLHRLCGRAPRGGVRRRAAVLRAEEHAGRARAVCAGSCRICWTWCWSARSIPGKVFDLTLPLADVAEGYRAMDERRAIKTLLRV